MKKYLKSVIYLFLTIAFSLACESERQTERGFYYWKSVFEWQARDNDFLAKLKVKKLYIKYFDVKWNEQKQTLTPVAKIEFRDKPSTIIGADVIPVVFITNESIKNLSDSLMKDLGKKIFDEIESINLKNNNIQVAEIQIDCDWTARTQKKYFALLTHLKSLLPKNVLLSATIRLHQVKYAKKQGIPPIDKGLLMCYNMDSPKKFTIQNSIFDLSVAKDYLKEIDEYPLKLDVALSIFAWGVIFEQGNFKGLINNLTISHLENNAAFKKIDKNRFVALANTRIKNVSIKAKDLIRVEESNLKEVQSLADFIADRLPKIPLNIVLFHYDAFLIKHHKQEDFAPVFEAFE